MEEGEGKLRTRAELDARGRLATRGRGSGRRGGGGPSGVRLERTDVEFVFLDVRMNPLPSLSVGAHPLVDLAVVVVEIKDVVDQLVGVPLVLLVLVEVAHERGERELETPLVEAVLDEDETRDEEEEGTEFVPFAFVDLLQNKLHQSL